MKVKVYHVNEGSLRILDSVTSKEIQKHFGLSESYVGAYIRRGLKLKRKFSIIPAGEVEVINETKNNLTDIQKKIINELCNCNMNKCEVARKMFFNLNTIIYHIEQIKIKTELDPNKFFDLIKLKNIVSS
ncbi:CdaR family transcriptional regulator [Lachnoclostridium phytofermentans]|uniref:Transcriptional regulator, CdaR n=1 Tax=Lachnoclostridium phytofermentans (strain ATCC 700394 / DSM 18823 / ISDg) TaxID=357809 RepID=A9KQ24_LACP7|nr:CdaR family transcriptional regulator [Lachnoclostridium phytofermentans]ABX43336.1 transcriptional regulator, CdaR [Lachnoclostridium phytofermentans ISDg]